MRPVHAEVGRDYPSKGADLADGVITRLTMLIDKHKRYTRALEQPATQTPTHPGEAGQTSRPPTPSASPRMQAPSQNTIKITAEAHPRIEVQSQAVALYGPATKRV